MGAQTQIPKFGQRPLNYPVLGPASQSSVMFKVINTTTRSKCVKCFVECVQSQQK